MLDPRSNPTRAPGSRSVHVSTGRAARTLDVPGRTVRRWCQQHQVGQLVAGRRVLSTADVEQLRQVRDLNAAAC